MPIEVELPDGSIVEFPEGTPNDVMERALKAHAAPWQPTKRSPDDLRRSAMEYRDRHPVTDDMSGAERFAASAGKSLSDTWMGLQQFVGAKSREDVEGKRRTDDALMNTPAGIAGNFGGSVAQVVTPGVLLKLMAAAPRLAVAAPAANTAARAFLPTSIPGSAAQGAVIGGIQPVGDDDSRGINVATGAALGGLGAAVPQGLGALYRGIRGNPVSATGAERRLAEILRSEAENPAALAVPQPSAIPGVQRTLAEESMDPGIARLERWARGNGNGFDPIDRANNAARVAALEQFAGDPAALKAAVGARNTAATPLRNQAMQDTGVDMDPITQAIEQGIAKNATRSSVRKAIEDVQAELANADGSVQSLYGVRKSIDDLLSGKAGSEKGYAKAATKELMDIKGVLDQQIATKSPAFAQYLDAFKSGSKEVDRMKVGQRLVRSGAGAAMPDAKTGLPNLTPAAFARATSDLDALSAKATGFRKAQASDILQPGDMATISNVQDDLSRVGFAATAGSGRGSPTQPLLALSDRVAGGMTARLPIVGKAYQYLAEVGQQRLQARLSEILADPAKARIVLSKVPANDRRVLETALARIGGTVGAASPAIIE